MSVPLEARFVQQHKLYLPLKDLSPQLFAQQDTLSFFAGQLTYHAVKW